MRVPDHDPRYVRTVADILPQAEQRADWRPVRGAYQQSAAIRKGPMPSTLPEELLESLAEKLDQISISYMGHEEEFCLHVLAVLADEDGYEVIDGELVRRYYVDDSLTGTMVPPAPRRPAVFEATMETCRRLRDAHRIREAMRGTGTSGLLCGSTNYGRFFNVRGGRGGEEASDLDMMIAMPDVGAFDAVVTQLRTVTGSDVADIDRLDIRRSIFTRALDDGRTTFSHRVRLWTVPMLPGDPAGPTYRLSLHFFTRPVLDYLLASSSPRLLRETVGSRRTIQDYREKVTELRDHQQTFTGLSHYLDLDTVLVEAGAIQKIGAYTIDAANRYSPGFYQTMLLPQPEPLWDELNVRPLLAEFRRKIAERIRYERQQQPFEVIRQSFAHLRRAVFAPRVIRFLDEGYTRY